MRSDSNPRLQQTIGLSLQTEDAFGAGRRALNAVCEVSPQLHHGVYRDTDCGCPDTDAFIGLTIWTRVTG